jgi:hypothetical protein
MNGRVFDPYINMFLSPDPYVQAPGLTQSYNRYSYGLGNPFIFVDPSGQRLTFSDILAGAAIVAGAITEIVAPGNPIGIGLIVSGVSHFGEALENYSQNNDGNWENASNEAGFSFSNTTQVNLSGGQLSNGSPRQGGHKYDLCEQRNRPTD